MRGSQTRPAINIAGQFAFTGRCPYITLTNNELGDNLNLNMISSHKGFTLIELLIVLVIIGLLAAIAIPIYQDITLNTRIAQVDIAYGVVSRDFNQYLLASRDYSPQTSSAWKCSAEYMSVLTNGASAELIKDQNNLEFGYCLSGAYFCFYVYTTTGYRQNPVQLVYIRTYTDGTKDIMVNRNNPLGLKFYKRLSGRGETVLYGNYNDGSPGQR